MSAHNRGFVTIATGKEHYYKVAYNLLCSYRLNAGGFPFAIICDRENKYTAAFDKAVLMKDPSRTYMDKLRLFECLPFDEAIFIDADCLVYGDIDKWWDLFDSADDFSVFGYASEDLSIKGGWFKTEGMGKYRDRIRFVPSFSGGVYFLRRTDACRMVFETAKEAAEHYGDYPFAIFSKPADEPLLALGMAVTGCRPVDCNYVGLYTYRKMTKADITVPTAEWLYKNEWNKVIMIHWGNFGSMKAFYLFEASAARRKLAGKPEKGVVWTLLYKYKLLYYMLHVCDIVTLWKRVMRRLRNRIKVFRR